MQCDVRVEHNVLLSLPTLRSCRTSLSTTGWTTCVGHFTVTCLVCWLSGGLCCGRVGLGAGLRVGHDD